MILFLGTFASISTLDREVQLVMFQNIKKEVVVDDGIKDFDTSHEAKLA